MTEIKLTKRYPQSRTEDIVDAYMRGWNDALDAVQNGKFIINDDHKDEPQTCDTCKFELYFPEMCQGCCEWDSHYEPKDEQSGKE